MQCVFHGVNAIVKKQVIRTNTSTYVTIKMEGYNIVILQFSRFPMFYWNIEFELLFRADRRPLASLCVRSTVIITALVFNENKKK